MEDSGMGRVPGVSTVFHRDYRQAMATIGAAGRAYRRRMLVDVGAVGQVDEDGVHVLHIRDDDGQVGQCRQRSGFVLILEGHTQRVSVHSVGLEGCCDHTCLGQGCVTPVFTNTHMNSYILQGGSRA